MPYKDITWPNVDRAVYLALRPTCHRIRFGISLAAWELASIIRLRSAMHPLVGVDPDLQLDETALGW